MGRWTVVCRPVEGKVSRKQVNGLAVVLTTTGGRKDDTLGVAEREVGRVAFPRDRSKNPDVPFDKMLEQMLKTAQTAADEINNSLDEFERAQEEELLNSRARIAELLGPARAQPEAGKME